MLLAMTTVVVVHLQEACQLSIPAIYQVETGSLVSLCDLPDEKVWAGPSNFVCLDSTNLLLALMDRDVELAVPGVLEWDYPRRVSDDGRELSCIPYEIYEEIFLYFDLRPENFDHKDAFGPKQSKRVLICISVTCRLFRHLPLSVCEVTIHPDIMFPPNDRCARMYKFCQDIVEAHDLQNPMYSSAMPRFIRRFTSYVKKCNLCAIHQFADYNVPLRTLSHFLNLQTLYLDEVTWPAFADTLFVSPQLKHLTSLGLLWCEGLSDEFIHLNNFTECLQELEMDNGEAFQTLAKKGPMHSLRSLRIVPSLFWPPSDFASYQLYELLPRAPNLVELSLDNVKLINPLPLASLHFNKLQHLSCSDQMLAVFAFPAASRDVALGVLRLYPEEKFRDGAGYAAVMPQHVAACLTELTVPYPWLLDEGGPTNTLSNRSHRDTLAKYFPRLEILSIFTRARTGLTDPMAFSTTQRSRMIMM
ncbi:hypothetical protein D9758_007020 [Tetrapyrgos nigripes]|uniref:F-box domain-containing protein n=1 Tax=Tetrapyrgos nigripes TaxID=182062 RepID=A0A8H5LMR2_9AGAR|nr:hypothetical protein D9758_007020 [Tetrapyrgos nigripes]